ncbi:MAG: ABC transporter ATP-binding protein [Deltaproteobacteria bacterium]|nr:ABC transporter ATP-binding protein [Deltaproteobacteria bacterium]
MTRDSLITCRRLCKSYYDIRNAERVVALDEISLEIPRGEFVTVIGPSGCGKTTLLYILAGFEEPTSGEVLVEDRPIYGPGADRGVVFQEYALFPWLTLRQNVEYGPRERGVPAEEAREIVNHTLRLVNLEGAENRYPHELSGGMRQRAALARVLVNDPKILLMDEPFAAVDAQTRAALQREVARLWAETGKTVLFITHSVEEAVLLGDRVVIMTARPGRVKADMAVSLQRPRDPTSPAFNDHRRAIEQLLADAGAATRNLVNE